MKTLRTARTTLLFAAACAALAVAGSGQASTGPGLSRAVLDPGEAWQFNAPLAAAQTVPAPTLEQMLEPFNYRDVNSATHFISQGAMAMQLEGRGLSKTGRGFVDTQQVDHWYSAAEDRSVVCVSALDGGLYTQDVFITPGKIRRADIVSLP